MRGKFFVTLLYVISLHFIQRFANECTGSPKHPHALGTPVAVKLLALCPNELARQCNPPPHAGGISLRGKSGTILKQVYHTPVPVLMHPDENVRLAVEMVRSLPAKRIER